MAGKSCRAFPGLLEAKWALLYQNADDGRASDRGVASVDRQAPDETVWTRPQFMFQRGRESATVPRVGRAEFSPQATERSHPDSPVGAAFRYSLFSTSSLLSRHWAALSVWPLPGLARSWNS